MPPTSLAKTAKNRATMMLRMAIPHKSINDLGLKRDNKITNAQGRQQKTASILRDRLDQSCFFLDLGNSSGFVSSLLSSTN